LIFEGTPADGQNPASGLIQDSAGNLYGTTQYGGTIGGGTIFKITRSSPRKNSICESVLKGRGFLPFKHDR
jgi:uncharacterized repeat protein (TIGR03803 family)